MEYTPREVADLLERDDDVQLVDVREPYEFDAGRIAGGVHIELATLSGRAGEIDRDRPVVFYCRSGARSAMATDAFRRAGYDAYNLAGGLLDWVAVGLPIEPDGGYVAK
jgi:rhodanese-related sulfurtransferase